jgi:polysaccharide export outer membrane protein
MPVRSRGSLLAGTATLASLLLAGFGCHSSPSDHDSFSLPNQPAQSSVNLSSPSDVPEVIAASSPSPSLASSNPVNAAPPSAGQVTLQPVPLVQTARQNREVIASTFQPVQRVSTEVYQSGPELKRGTPSVISRTALLSAQRANSTPMPVGTPPANNGPTLEGGDAAAPGNLVLPPPRPLAAPPASVVYDHAMVPPTHAPYQSVPREFEKMALPPYVVEPPDILLIQASDRITLRLQHITGQHLVAPDGTVNLGIYGQIRVAGMTLDQVATAVAERLTERMPGLLKGLKITDKDGKDTNIDAQQEWRHDFTSLDLIKREMQVDVLAYNSKFYYVITDGGGYGQQVYPMPIRGNETVLDAMANINGLPSVANKKRIWVARATRAGQPPKILPVDWMSLVKCGSSATNYQLFPGDRVYVDSNNLIKADTFLSKLLSPAQRVLGVTLLGASTVNSIKFGAESGSGLGGFGAFR